MIIFLEHAGPKIEYVPPQRPQAVPIHGVLKIEDLNPEVKLSWRVSRGELVKIGLRCLLASVQW